MINYKHNVLKFVIDFRWEFFEWLMMNEQLYSKWKLGIYG